MKKLLGTTAILLIMAGAAHAQTASQTPVPPASQSSAESLAYLAAGDAKDIYVSDLVGATIYAADAGETTAASRADWDRVGVISDVLLTRTGDVRAVLVDVGTFLGMGGKTVAAPLDSIRYVSDGPDAAEYFLVITANRETLQGAPAYIRPEIREKAASMTSSSSVTTGGMASKTADRATDRATGLERPADRTAAAAVAGAPMAAAPMFAYPGYDRTENRDLTADDLTSATVYGQGDQTIGSISSLILDKDGQITHAVVDVGGFLGMGARSVSLPFSDLTVLRATSGTELRIYVDTTKDRLEAMPEYKG